MPIPRTNAHNSLSLPNSPQKSYTLSSHLSTQYEESHSTNDRISTKRLDSPRKPSGSAQKLPTTPLTTSQTSRRSVVYDTNSPMRRRANTDVQNVTSPLDSLQQQKAAIGVSGSDKAVHQNYQRIQSPIPPKPKWAM